MAESSLSPLITKVLILPSCYSMRPCPSLAPTPYGTRDSAVSRKGWLDGTKAKNPYHPIRGCWPSSHPWGEARRCPSPSAP
jgi:hypothetical protein